MQEENDRWKKQMMHACRRPHGGGSSVSRLLPSRIISPLNDTLKPSLEYNTINTAVISL